MQLIPGKFYWVRPEFDVDFIPEDSENQEYDDRMFKAMWEHWTQNDQPAYFKGYSEFGQEQWIYLGSEEDPKNYWPACWVGKEVL